VNNNNLSTETITTRTHPSTSTTYVCLDM